MHMEVSNKKTLRWTKKSLLVIIRLTDIILVLCGFVITAPILLFTSLCIKLEDPNGSIFFKQERIGLNGRKFHMYKFRSMTSDAEKKLSALQELNEMDGMMFKMKEDPRITKVGKIIRKISLDEFPQFLNILKGDMSLIGPRPPLVSEFENYTLYAKQRMQVKPGCTGLWQVSGRNQLSFNEMIELDLYYIKNLSIMLNIKIFLLTFKEFTHKGSGY